MELDLEELRRGFAGSGFIIDEEDLNIVYLALRLDKPLLVSGPPGVGKTDLARVLSRIFAARLIRLQCHEGLDESKALYDWNFQRQLVKIHLSTRSKQIKAGRPTVADNPAALSLNSERSKHRGFQPGVQAESTPVLNEDELFSLPNLLQRPLLQAITATGPVVLLIDEIDRAEIDFEAFLLEVLSDFQISVPEIGTIKASRKPIVVITNNGERELSEALRRRCVFLYLNFPNIEQETSIIKAKQPAALEELREEIALAVARAKDAGQHPHPGAETGLDWAQALFLLDADNYQTDYVENTLEMLAKNKEHLLSYQEFLQRQGNAKDEKQEKASE